MDVTYEWYIIFNKKSVLPEGRYELRGGITWLIVVRTGGRYSLIVWIPWKLKNLGFPHIVTYICIKHKCMTCFWHNPFNIAENMTTMVIFVTGVIHGLRGNIPCWYLIGGLTISIWWINLNYTQTNDLVGYTPLNEKSKY